MVLFYHLLNMATYIKRGYTGYRVQDSGVGLLLFYPFAFPASSNPARSGDLPLGLPDPLDERDPTTPRMLFFSLEGTDRLALRRLQKDGTDLARKRRKTLYLRDESVFKDAHATLQLKDGRWWILDSRTAQRKMAGQNAVTVNGQQLSKRRELVGGEIIAVGRVLLRFLSANMAGSSAADTIWATYHTPFVGGPRWQSVVQNLNVLRGYEWQSTTNILITGKSGTGKERAARSFKEEGRPFLALNCATIPETLLDGELFGYLKGAFTGAARNTKGKFELAHGGTLLLDEIGEMNLNSQAKLLRVLQEGEITRLGSSQVIKVDVRTVAATNLDLEQQVRRGEFREDLYHRVKAIALELPPLCQGPEDVPLLIRHILLQERFRHDQEEIAQSSYLPLSSHAMEWLCTHSWPGNVRELQDVMKQAMVNFTTDKNKGKIRFAHLGVKEHRPARAEAPAARSPAPRPAAGEQPEEEQPEEENPYLQKMGKNNPSEYLRQYFLAEKYLRLQENKVAAFKEDGQGDDPARAQVRRGRDQLLKLVQRDESPEEVARRLLKVYRLAGEALLRRLAAQLKDRVVVADILIAKMTKPPKLDTQRLGAIGEALIRAMDSEPDETRTEVPVPRR